MTKDEIQNFKDNIWKTRKARINLAERLRKRAEFTKFLNIYYSCVIIIFNLIATFYHQDNMNNILLAMSIVLTISITFLDSQQYLQRSEIIKKCYIDLQNLYYELNDDNFSSIKEKYFELLKETENHSENDYMKVLISLNRATFGQNIKYYLIVGFFKLVKIAIVMLPIFLAVLFRIYE